MAQDKDIDSVGLLLDKQVIIHNKVTRGFDSGVPLKNSGVQWIENIPCSWKLLPLKHNLYRLSNKSKKRGKAIALENIESWTGKKVETETIFDSDRITFQRNDILFGKLRPYLAKVYLAEVHGHAVGDLWVLRPQPNINPKFAAYQLLEPDFIDLINSSTTGTKMPRADWGYVGSISVPTPPLKEQTAIAVFLDNKTTKIDQAIKIREQQITLLNEYRQIIIQNAVTRGLDSSVSLKNSGVQWIGNIPCSWKLVRFGNLFTERRQKVSDRDYKPLSVTKTGIYPQLENVAKSDDADNRKLVKAGDFVINSRSDRKGSSGVSSLDGSVSLINIVLEPKNIIPGFCNYILKSHAFVEEYYRMGHGIVSDLWTTRYDKMRTIVMPLPSIEEQKIITNSLDIKTACIYQAIEIKTRQIAALKEYRATLVNAAVTGKLDIT